MVARGVLGLALIACGLVVVVGYATIRPRPPAPAREPPVVDMRMPVEASSLRLPASAPVAEDQGEPRPVASDPLVAPSESFEAAPAEDESTALDTLTEGRYDQWPAPGLHQPARADPRALDAIRGEGD